MKKRYIVNTLTSVFIYLIFLFVIFTFFDSTLGKLESDFLSQHTKFIDYISLNYMASGDLFPQLMMNYGLGQSFAILYYHGVLNPFLSIVYLLPRTNPIYILEIVYLFLIVINTIAMTKLLDLNGIKGNLNTFIAISSSFSGYFIYHMTNHPMFIYYIPILVVSLVALHYMAKANIKSLYIVSVGLIFYTNFTFAPIISVLQFLYYIGLLVESKNLKVKKLLVFLVSYIVGVGIGLMVLIPQALLVLAATTRTQSLALSDSLFLSLEQVIDSLSTNPYMSGIFVFAVAAIIGTLLFLRTKRFMILIVPMLLILIIAPLNIAFNLFVYIHLKIYIWFMPILWLLFGLVVQKINKRQLMALLIGSLIVIIIGHQDYQNLIVAVILLIWVLINFTAITISNKYIQYIIVVALAFSSLLNHSKTVSTYEIESYTLNAEDTENLEFTNSRTVNEDKNNLDSISNFSSTITTSLENGYYLQAVRDEYESVKSSTARNTKSYTFDNPYYENFFGLENQSFESNPIIYGVNKQDILNISKYQNLNSTKTMEAVSQYLFTTSSDNTDYNSKFNIETIIDDSSEFTLSDEDTWRVDVPEEYLDGILTITMTADIPEDTSVKQRFYINGQLNEVMYADRFGVNDNHIVTFIIDTVENPRLKIGVKNMRGGDITYSDLKVTYQSFDDFTQNKLDPVIPTNFTVDLNDSFSFEIEMEEEGYIATTIPYDSGFTFTIDGEEVETEFVNNLYVGAKISKGTHNVVLSYQIPGFKIGQIITCIALALTVILLLIDIRSIKLTKYNQMIKETSK